MQIFKIHSRGAAIGRYRSGRIAALAVAITLVGCGGGDGGSTSATGTTATPQPVTPVVTAPQQIGAAVAWSNLVTKGGTWALTGTGSDGASYSATLTVTPGADSMLTKSGTQIGPFGTVDAVATVKRNGITASTNSLRLYLDKPALTVQLGLEPSLSRCIVISSKSPVPDLAVVNQAGLLFAGDEYGTSGNTCSGVISYAAVNTTWAYELDKNVPLFCVRIGKRDIIVSTDSWCFETSAAGALGAKAKIESSSSDGKSLLLTNY